MTAVARAAVVGAAVALLVTAGCGADREDPGPDPTTAGPAVTLTDARGEVVELDSVPERVYLTSYRHVLDELLMLGRPPVAYGAHPAEELPVWTREVIERDGVEIEVLEQVEGPNFEEIAAQRPDAIIAAQWEEEYFDEFEAIAPLVVVEQAVDVEGERLEILGDLVGRSERAAELAATMTDGLDEVRTTEDEIALIFGFAGDGGPRAAVEWADVPGREGAFLTELGFTVKSDWPFEQNEFGYAEIAEENFPLLDEADTVWNIGPYPGNSERDVEALRSSPVLRSLDVYQRGDVHFLSVEVSQALVQWTPLATPTLVAGIDELVAEGAR